MDLLQQKKMVEEIVENYNKTEIEEKIEADGEDDYINSSDNNHNKNLYNKNNNKIRQGKNIYNINNNINHNIKNNNIYNTIEEDERKKNKKIIY